MAIIDSSALVSFAKIQKLDLVSLLKTKMATVKEVYEECVEKGMSLGYPDALKIKQLFDEKTINIEDLKNYEKFLGVSEVDSKIISLAKKKKDYLFGDDVKLGRRAKAENVEVRNTPDILLHLMKTKRLTKKEFRALLQKLVNNKRLSEKTKNFYEKAGGE
jgi:predicted nucleic acid-binding protein